MLSVAEVAPLIDAALPMTNCARILRIFVPNRSTFAKIFAKYGSEMHHRDIRVCYGRLCAPGANDPFYSMMLLHGGVDGLGICTSVPSCVSESGLLGRIHRHVAQAHNGRLKIGDSVIFGLDVGFDFVAYASLHEGRAPSWNENMYRSCIGAFRDIPLDVRCVHAEIPMNINRFIDPVRAFDEMRSAFRATH